MKFCKELEAQVILDPWKDEYMDYRQLKKIVKTIKLSTSTSTSSTSTSNHDNYGLISMVRSFLRRPSPNPDQIPQPPQVKLFFEKLGMELEMVNLFYTNKESELLERGEMLNGCERLLRIQDMVRGAFVELYGDLYHLMYYSYLNMTAFEKILKKFNKVSNQSNQLSTTHLRAVQRSHFTCSDKVVRLMDELETSFTKHFAEGDRKKAMAFLRPWEHDQDSYWATYFAGMLSGFFVSLGFAIIVGTLLVSSSPAKEVIKFQSIFRIVGCNWRMEMQESSWSSNENTLSMDFCWIYACIYDTWIDNWVDVGFKSCM